MQRYFDGLSRNTFLLALSSLFADISTEMLTRSCRFSSPRCYTQAAASSGWSTDLR